MIIPVEILADFPMLQLIRLFALFERLPKYENIYKLWIMFANSWIWTHGFQLNCLPLYHLCYRATVTTSAHLDINDMDIIYDTLSLAQTTQTLGIPNITLLSRCEIHQYWLSCSFLPKTCLHKKIVKYSLENLSSNLPWSKSHIKQTLQSQQNLNSKQKVWNVFITQNI